MVLKTVHRIQTNSFAEVGGNGNDSCPCRFIYSSMKGKSEEKNNNYRIIQELKVVYVD